jgi:hypothetical protein
MEAFGEIGWALVQVRIIKYWPGARRRPLPHIAVKVVNAIGRRVQIPL